MSDSRSAGDSVDPTAAFNHSRFDDHTKLLLERAADCAADRVRLPTKRLDGLVNPKSCKPVGVIVKEPIGWGEAFFDYLGAFGDLVAPRNRPTLVEMQCDECKGQSKRDCDVVVEFWYE